MASSAPVRSTPARMPSPWRLALVAGVCFGLGYGVVQRLMQLELPRGGRLSEPFRMRQFPGTSLDSLRLKLGEEPRPLRGDLGVLEQQEQQRKAEEERARRDREMEAERRRESLADDLDRDLEPAPAPPLLPDPAPPPAADPPPPPELPAPPPGPITP
ncbi:hypothetical protein [Cyanobium sp. CH-040]|uniref:hypothetical protein n=1 Tax=Cyanobium sp. CH-040 TaxID=2823708 RepID=UPI0020CE157F|nr:hypothetical protein [Cyanobium sp. CH-040]